MRNVFEHIQELDDMPSYTKYYQLVEEAVSKVRDILFLFGKGMEKVFV